MGETVSSDTSFRQNGSTGCLQTSGWRSRAELAERTGISQADISRIERGATSPTAKTLQRIAEALNAEVRLVAKTA